MVKTYVPDRGDVIWLNFSPQAGHEQAGVRPALVLSPETYNTKSGLILSCPITSKIKGYPFEVRLKTKKIDGVILADQLKSLSWQERKATFIENVSEKELKQTLELIGILINV